MEFNIKALKDASGNKYVPVTHPKAVINETGKTLEEELTEIKSTSGGTSGSVPTPTVSKLDFYFDAVSTQGFLLPVMVFDCSEVTDFVSGGTFTVEFTPEFTNSPAQIKRVDDWWGWNGDGSLSWSSVNTYANTDGNTTSGTRFTITRTLTPPADKNYLMIIPKFVMTDGETDTTYQVSVNDLVVKLNGVEIPKNTLVNAGLHSSYTAGVNAVKANRYTNLSSVYIPSRWASRRVCTEGDSITAYTNGSGPRYPQILKDILKPNDVVDRAASGKAVSNFGTTNALVNHVNKHFDFDLLTIALGVNDYSFNTPLGSIGLKSDATTSFDKGTFYGAYRYCLDKILESNQYITIVMLTPITKKTEAANTAGHTLQAYRDAIVELGKMYNIPVYHTDFVLNQKNIDTFLYDGLHANDAGHRKYAENLGSYLASV